MMKRILLAALVGAAFATSAAAQNRGGDWVDLGSRMVADRMETDVVNLPGKRRFSAIRLCVKRRAVRFKDLDVVFANGGKQDLKIRKRIGPGECTRAIDLRGQDRDLARIIMRYETIRDKGPQAIVQISGRR